MDTYKVLSRLRRYKCTLYNNSDAVLDRLESDLEKDTARYAALYVEFPGNPLLASPNLVRIHALAADAGFLSYWTIQLPPPSTSLFFPTPM